MPSQSGISGPPFSIPGLTPNTPYDVRVRASNSAGTSAWSAWQRTTTTSGSTGGGGGGGGGGTRPYFNLAEWLWAPIPANPVLDSQSAAIAAMLAESGKGQILNTYEYGVKVVDAPSSAPKYDVQFTAGWGDPFGALQVPIPNGTVVPPGSDGHVAIIDRTNNRVFNFWQANFSGSTKTASYGAMVALDGDGREAISGTYAGSSTGANLARLAGIIRLSEMQAGLIPHALFFSTDRAVGPDGSSNFRYPAVKTDANKSPGQYPALIPEGARIQLNPSLNIDGMNMTAGEKTIAKALQTYGAYCGDNGGARMAFIAEYEGSDPGATYSSKGIGWDYFGLTGIPWSQLRVLKSWNGA